MITFNKYLEKEKFRIKNILDNNPIKIEIAAIQIGENRKTSSLFKNIKKDLEDIGIIFHWYFFDKPISLEDLLKEIDDLKEFYNIIITDKDLAFISDEKIYPIDDYNNIIRLIELKDIIKKAGINI